MHVCKCMDKSECPHAHLMQFKTFVLTSMEKTPFYRHFDQLRRSGKLGVSRASLCTMTTLYARTEKLFATFTLESQLHNAYRTAPEVWKRHYIPLYIILNAIHDVDANHVIVDCLDLNSLKRESIVREERDDIAYCENERMQKTDAPSKVQVEEQTYAFEREGPFICMPSVQAAQQNVANLRNCMMDVNELFRLYDYATTLEANAYLHFENAYCRVTLSDWMACLIYYFLNKLGKRYPHLLEENGDLIEEPNRLGAHLAEEGAIPDCVRPAFVASISIAQCLGCIHSGIQVGNDTSQQFGFSNHEQLHPLHLYTPAIEMCVQTANQFPDALHPDGAATETNKHYLMDMQRTRFIQPNEFPEMVGLSVGSSE